MGRKRLRDPQKPKRAMTAFLFFHAERRAVLKAEFPQLGFEELGRRVGAAWKSVGAEERKRFEEMAAVDRERLTLEMATYTPDPRYPKKKRRSKDPMKPKKAWTAYLYFCSALRSTVRAEHPEKDMREVQTELAARWSATSKQERHPYEMQAKADRKRYQEQLAKRQRQADEEAAAAAAEEEEAEAAEGNEEEEEGAGENEDEVHEQNEGHDHAHHHAEHHVDQAVASFVGDALAEAVPAFEALQDHP